MASPSTSTSEMIRASSSSTLASGFVGTPFATDPRFDYPFPPTAAQTDDHHLTTTTPPKDRPRSHSVLTSPTHPSGPYPPHPGFHPSASSPKVLRSLAENPPIPPRLLTMDLDDILMARRCCEETMGTATNSRGQLHACSGRFRAASSKP